MNKENAKPIRDLIEEHGRPARARWREVFDEMREDGEDNDTAAGIADDVIRKEVERGVLESDEQGELNRRARTFVNLVDMHRSDDCSTIESGWIRSIAEGARDLAREFRS